MTLTWTRWLEVYLLDVNVVVAAFRNDHAHHREVRRWFDLTLAEREPFTAPVWVWHALLRLATNRRVFPVPSSPTEVLDFVDAVDAQPGYTPLAPGPRHLALVRRMCDRGSATGDLIPDAVLAAVAVEFDCEVVSMDQDFKRFPVRLVNPLH